MAYISRFYPLYKIALQIIPTSQLRHVNNKSPSNYSVEGAHRTIPLHDRAHNWWSGVLPVFPKFLLRPKLRADNAALPGPGSLGHVNGDRPAVLPFVLLCGLITAYQNVLETRQPLVHHAFNILRVLLHNVHLLHSGAAGLVYQFYEDGHEQRLAKL